MKLTVRQLKQLIKEQVAEQFYETSKKEDEEDEEFNFEKNDEEDDVAEDDDSDDSHSSASLKDAQKAFESAAGAYLKALIGDDMSRFEAVQQLVSLLRKVFKGRTSF